MSNAITLWVGRGWRIFPALLMAAALTCAAAQKPPQDHKVFGDLLLWQWAPERSYHVEHYRLAMHFDQARGEIFGDEIITLSPFTDDFRQLRLDSVGLHIDSATTAAPQGATSAAGTPLRFERHDPVLTIDLGRSYPAGARLAVHIVYHGFPQTGLIFINPDKNYPNAPREIWSQGESEFNRYWYPSWDYPNDRATSEMIITVPKGQVAVSNGKLVSVQKKDGQVTYHWVESVPHSSYLNSVAVGPWRKVEQHDQNIPVDYYVPNYVDKTTALRSFGLTPDMMAFFAQRFGVAYPYSKYAQVAVHNFTEGGMENISATTQTEWTLHDQRADVDFPSTDLVAHELAHQWFGDLVTTRDWADIWLNEGFASYMEALYEEHHAGEDAYRFAIWGDQNDARTEDDTLYRRPIISRHYTYPEQMFDNTTYLKGAAVLAMLRYVLGDQGFFASLHHYLVVNREKNVDVADLMEAIRETTGQNLDWFFHEWLFMGGYPQYRVRATYEPQQKVEVVTVEQTQTLNAVTPLFDMPVELAFHGPDGAAKQVRVRVRKAAETFYVPLSFRPLWSSFDPNDEIYKTVDFEKPVPELAGQAEHDPAMMSRLWATLELGRRGQQAYDAALTALSQVLQRDQANRVRAAAAEALGELGGDEAKTVLLATLHDRNSLVRAGAAAGLAHFHADSAVGQGLVPLLQDDSYAVQMAAAVSLGRSQAPQAFDALRAALPAAKDDHVRQGILVGLAASQHDGVGKLLLAEARPGVPEFPRVIAMRLLPQVQSQIAVNDPDLEAVVKAGLKDSFPFAQNAAMSLVGAFKLEQYKPELEQLATSLPTADQRKAANDALNTLEGHPTTAQTIGKPPTVSDLEQRVKQLQDRLQTLQKVEK